MAIIAAKLLRQQSAQALFAGTAELWNADDHLRVVGRSIEAIAPSDCTGYFRHAGYRA